MLQNLIDQTNAKSPFAYRLDAEGEQFTVIPTHTRDVWGRVIEIVPLLDRRVTIPHGTRSIAETANLMTTALSAQTGLRVSCCQAFIAGVPWGLANIAFEAHDESARDVLRRLILADLQGRPSSYHWLERCDPQPSAWCFINLSYVAAEQRPFTPKVE